MRIALHDYAGYGFIVQLSRELSQRGHRVFHLYAQHNPTPKGILRSLPGDSEELVFVPVAISEPFQKYSLIRRRRQEREYGQKLATAVDEVNPQVVISAQTPLDAQVSLTRYCTRRDLPQAIWVQDLISVAMTRILSQRLSVFGKIIGRYYERIEQRLVSSANMVFTITEDFLPIMESWGLDLEKVHIIPNWAPIDDLPVLDRVNPWSTEMGLDESFAFLYSGTLGFRHNPSLLL